MGNMLPCSVQARATTLPPISSKHRSHSIKLLTRALHNMKRRRCHKAKVNKQEASAADQSKPSSMPLPSRRAHRKQGVVRVKVVLTRKEAARLLSLTAHGEKTAAQVVRELGSKEVGRGNAAAAWRPALESIPEEYVNVVVG